MAISARGSPDGCLGRSCGSAVVNHGIIRGPSFAGYRCLAIGRFGTTRGSQGLLGVGRGAGAFGGTPISAPLLSLGGFMGRCQATAG